MWLRVIVLLTLIYTSELLAETPITIGNQYVLSSSVLKEERRVSVYLPRGYERAPDASYDVLYLLDGGVNLLHTVGSQYFLAGYRQMPELIIVGIHNTIRDRDFTPSAVKDIPESGGANNFRAFIKQELFPFVNKKFRTTDKRYLSGHSYGGLFAIDTLVKSADMFNAYFSFSPSLRWDNDLVLNTLLKKIKSNKLDSYLYINIGDEGYKMTRPIFKLHEALKTNTNSLFRWNIDWLENENHSTTPVIGQFLAFRHYFSNKGK